MAVFVSVRKDEEKKGKKTKKLSQFLKLHTVEVILLKFGVWNTEVGRRVHCKNWFVS